jgi:hypothetical protein
MELCIYKFKERYNFLRLSSLGLRLHKKYPELFGFTLCISLAVDENMFEKNTPPIWLSVCLHSLDSHGTFLSELF